MNEMNPLPPPLPPALSSAATAPPGVNPDEQEPIRGFIAAVESILRQPRRLMFQLRQPGAGSVIAALLAIAVVCSLVYGVVVGTFSMGTQLWAAPVKITAGLLVSAIICLPSLYIFSCLAGSPARLVEVFGLLAGLLALMTVLLVGFAPVAWVFSQSTQSVAWMGVLHLAFWLIATWFGLRFLHAGFEQLGGNVGIGIQVWAVIFLLVMLQMTTALRPIIGTAPDFWQTEKKFFMSHWAECLKSSDTDTKPRGGVKQ